MITVEIHLPGYKRYPCPPEKLGGRYVILWWEESRVRHRRELGLREGGKQNTERIQMLCSTLTFTLGHPTVVNGNQPGETKEEGNHGDGWVSWWRAGNMVRGGCHGDGGLSWWRAVTMVTGIGVWGGGGGQGAAALPNSGKTVGKIRAKQEEKIGEKAKRLTN